MIAVGIEPSIVRMSDIDSATLQVMLDNRRGLSGVRIFLDGSNPEGPSGSRSRCRWWTWAPGR